MTDDTITPGQEKSLQALEKARTATQFGGPMGNRPNNSPGGKNTKTWSLKHSIRYLAKQQIEAGGKGIPMPESPTVIQMIAANTLAKATKGDMRAVQFIGEQIDGKPHQININAEFEDLMTKTPEELDEIERELDRALEYARGTNPAEESQADGDQESAGAQQSPAGADSDKPIV